MTALSDHDMLRNYVPASLVEMSELVEKKERVDDLVYGSARVHGQGLAPSDSGINSMIYDKKIVIDPLLEEDQVQPASLDLRVGNTVYVTDRTFSKLDDEILKRHAIEKRELTGDDTMVLYPGNTYIVESYESIRLPQNIEGETDTKSTVGRIGASCLTAGEKFSHISSGDLLSGAKRITGIFEPQAFSFMIRPRITRAYQIRFRYKGTSYATSAEIKELYGKEVFYSKDLEGKEQIPISDVLEEDGLRLTLNTSKAFAQRKDSTEVLDLTKKEHYDPGEFWEVVKPNRWGEIVMEANRLYLFGSNETINFGNACGRLRREDPYAGFGLRLHFAGFFDPGFVGQGTLEFWSEKKRVLQPNQHAGRILVEQLSSPVSKSYGAEQLGSSYAGQSAPRHAKIFRHSDEFE